MYQTFSKQLYIIVSLNPLRYFFSLSYFFYFNRGKNGHQVQQTFSSSASSLKLLLKIEMENFLMTLVP